MLHLPDGFAECPIVSFGKRVNRNCHLNIAQHGQTVGDNEQKFRLEKFHEIDF
jgi:hypothetical protein